MSDLKVPTYKAPYSQYGNSKRSEGDWPGPLGRFAGAKRLMRPCGPGQSLSRKSPRLIKTAIYLAVGITNSAPLPMLSGQRCMMDFCLV